MIGYMANNTMQAWLLSYGKTSKRKRCWHHQKSRDLEKKLKMSKDIAESVLTKPKKNIKGDFR
jgi:hypothetical protein